ncbi:MAG TPA: hypothetical protein GX730_07340 [Chloroflexi bacterium]|nr:alpha-amylase family glycosyl hydrolase [Anaerolineaceae bacterium]HHX09220.1 hypothetical protein [Chloroflexota bacterium]
MTKEKKQPELADHIFGDLDKSPKNLRYHRQRVLGVHHWDQVKQLQAKDGYELAFTSSTHSQLSVQSLTLEWSDDDWATRQELAFEKTELMWDTLTWGWLQNWQAQLQVQPEKLIRYYVKAKLSNGQTIYADNQAKTEKQATQFAQWLSPANVAPAWSKTARIYQIYLDRFNPGSGSDWLQTEDVTKHFGGTLRGVIEKLDYIRELGFNTIWLTPIFRSPSHHGYDSSDYTQIEPQIGTEADLEELVTKAHQRGLRILLDFVANHCSDQHPVFQKELKGSEAPQTSWFRWQKWPEKYACFFKVKSMPEFDLSYGSPARTHLLEVAQKWLRFGVDGYRLDYANGPERDFWVDFQRACLQVHPLCWTFGEVVAPVDELLQFSGSMHGTLDFLTCQALRETFARGIWSASRLASYLETSLQAFPQAYSRPSFIDNHDMNRFFFTAGENKAALHAALTLLFLLPQPPLLYYGTEVPLSQMKSIHDHDSVGFDVSRLAMDWDEEKDPKSRILIRSLSKFREENAWLAEAHWETSSFSRDGTRATMEVSRDGHKLRVTILQDKNKPLVFFQVDPR